MRNLAARPFGDAEFILPIEFWVDLGGRPRFFTCEMGLFVLSDSISGVPSTICVCFFGLLKGRLKLVVSDEVDGLFAPERSVNIGCSLGSLTLRSCNVSVISLVCFFATVMGRFCCVGADEHICCADCVTTTMGWLDSATFSSVLDFSVVLRKQIGAIVFRMTQGKHKYIVVKRCIFLGGKSQVTDSI